MQCCGSTILTFVTLEILQHILSTTLFPVALFQRGETLINAVSLSSLSDKNELKLPVVLDDDACHPECNSGTSCWGDQDHQCDSCLNFSYLNRCVFNCSVIIATLPANNSGVFVDEENQVCEPCDAECVGGCNGGAVCHTLSCSNGKL